MQVDGDLGGRLMSALELKEQEARRVTRALTKVLGFDPATHDLTAVGGKWPGVRVFARSDLGEVKFVRQAEVDRLLEDPETQIAMQAFIETDHG